MVHSLKRYLKLTIADAFQKILDDSKRKPNEMWIDKVSEFYSRSMKSWSQENTIKMHSTHKEGKSIVAEKFIRAIKSKIYKYATLISQNVYIDKLDDIVNEYNNTYHRTIKMPVDAKIIHVLTLVKKVMIKILNLKLVIM